MRLRCDGRTQNRGHSSGRVIIGKLGYIIDRGSDDYDILKFYISPIKCQTCSLRLAGITSIDDSKVGGAVTANIQRVGDKLDSSRILDEDITVQNDLSCGISDSCGSLTVHGYSRATRKTHQRCCSFDKAQLDSLPLRAVHY